MSDDRKPTAELAKTARNLASELFKGPCEEHDRPPRCLERDETPKGKRPGSKPERVSFLDLDPKAMCLPCSAYWHAERAAQLLEHRLADEYAAVAAKKEERTC